MSKENPYKCPRCDTLINELPATCRVCGTRLKSPPPRPERPVSEPVRWNMLGPISAVICMIGWGGYLVFPEGPFKIVSALAVMSGPISWIILADRRSNAALFVVSLMLAALFALGLLFLGVIQNVCVVGH